MFGNASNIEFFLMLFVLGTGILALMMLSVHNEEANRISYFPAFLAAATAAIVGLVGCVYYTLMPDKIYFYDDPRVDKVLLIFWVAAAAFWLLAAIEMVFLRKQSRQ